MALGLVLVAIVVIGGIFHTKFGSSEIVDLESMVRRKALIFNRMGGV